MTKYDDVSAKLDAVVDAIAELKREIGILVAGGDGATAEQLAALDAKLTTALAAAKDADPNP